MDVITDLVRDVIRPRTDAMVVAQVVILLGVIAFGVWRTWRIRELRMLVIGAGVFVLGLMMLRASH